MAQRVSPALVKAMGQGKSRCHQRSLQHKPLCNSVTGCAILADLKGVSKSVQVLSNGIAASMVLLT